MVDINSEENRVVFEGYSFSESNVKHRRVEILCIFKELIIPLVFAINDGSQR